MIYIISIVIKPFSEPLYPVDGGIVEESARVRREMFHHRIKVSSQINCSELLLQGDKTSQTILSTE